VQFAKKNKENKNNPALAHAKDFLPKVVPNMSPDLQVVDFIFGLSYTY
tara:strand:+ start:56 stop:199 length:144 start_codon:yes stop_codon:yes gene_type:complete